MRTLAELATRMGILAEYVDQTGRERRVASDETRVAILAAMGVDASTEHAARLALEALNERERQQVMPPVRVVREAEARERALRFHIPEHWLLGAGGSLGYECELRAEDGSVITHGGTAERSVTGEVNVALPPSVVRTGYARLRLRLHAGDRTHEAEQRLVVVPASCERPSRRAFGIIANLYTLRSARNWGVGNLGDLAELAAWCAAQGGAFVGVNPLHALRNTGTDISPYSPVSRLYRNSIYLDVEAIPELAECAEARALLASTPVRAELERLRAAPRVDYGAIDALARPVLELLHRTFVTRHRGTGDARDADWARYVEHEGDSLSNFALFRALDEHFAAERPSVGAWSDWPAPFRSPASPEVAAFRAAHTTEIDRHRWVQFELDRQLAHAARRAREAGLDIGLYQDLAIGSARSGSDAWSHQDLFLSGVSLGAPPDDYAAEGQNWGIPPLSPHRLHETGYAYWIALLRAALRHSGALRVDHVLGLFRQFWIPEGKTGADGAYVRFPTHDLFGILALESVRHHAPIVGEDLGTVPPEVPGTLAEWGVLGTRVMLFEREDDGRFRPASSYPALSLTTADTHDMAPLAGFWQERDIDLRREVGLLTTDAQLRDARAARARDRRALLERLAAVDATTNPVAPAELRGAVHQFLCDSPALLVGLSLDDLTGETEPVNIPGVGAERFPSWTRRMRTPIEALADDPEVRAALRCRRGPTP